MVVLMLAGTRVLVHSVFLFVLRLPNEQGCVRKTTFAFDSKFEAITDGPTQR